MPPLDRAESMIDVLILLIFVTIVIICVHSLLLSGRNIFEPIYFFLMGYFGVFVLQAYKGRKELLPFYGEDHISYCLFIAWFALIVFYVGYRSRFAKRLPLRLPQPPAKWPPGRLVPYALFLLILGLSGQLLFISQSGGAETYFTASRGAGAFQSSTAYIYAAKWLLVPAFAILFIEIARKGASRRVTYIAYFTAILFFLYQIWIGQRSGVFLMGVAILAWYYLPRLKTTKLPLMKISIVVTLVFMLVGFVAKFRGNIYLGSDFTELKYFADKSPEEQLVSLFSSIIKPTKTSFNSEVDGYFGTLNVVPDQVGYDYGKYYLRYSYCWIPRLIWHNKPYVKDTIRNLVDAVSAMYCGTNTMLGMYYYNFGLFGIFLGSFVTGICLGALEYWRKLRPDNYGVLLVYLLFFQWGRGVVMSEGLLGGLETTIPFSVMPILGAFWYLKLKKKQTNTMSRNFIQHVV